MQSLVGLRKSARAVLLHCGISTNPCSMDNEVIAGLLRVAAEIERLTRERDEALAREAALAGALKPFAADATRVVEGTLAGDPEFDASMREIHAALANVSKRAKQMLVAEARVKELEEKEASDV